MKGAVALLLVLVAGEVSGVLPGFGWGTLGEQAFFHSSNRTGWYTDEAIRFMARFRIVTIEKWMALDIANATMEDNIMRTLQDVKRANPATAAVFYYNSVCDFPQYKLYAKFEAMPDGWLRNSTSVIWQDCAGWSHMPVFDFSQAKVRDLWSAECTDLVKQGIDGCFADRAVDGAPSAKLDPAKRDTYDAGHLQVLQDTQEAMGDEAFLIANHAYSMPKVKAAQLEFCSPTLSTLRDLEECASSKKICECHAADTTNTLAVYLLGAYGGKGYGSYFGFGPWVSSDRWSKEWEAQYWPPFFDRPLGTPKGSYTKNGTVYTREFVSPAGTTVATFDSATNKGHVEWAA
eukprot:Sspe_Gene.109149::Locus_88597_Transcript_1_1_Confidence_1.000_Length_1201::g.109149::m.109149